MTRSSVARIASAPPIFTRQGLMVAAVSLVASALVVSGLLMIPLA